VEVVVVPGVVLLALTVGVLVLCWGLARRVLATPLPARPELPAADRPPAQLRPLIPSPRAVEEEVRRGLRDLQVWLADQAR
jgi:hypothetical protein